MLISKMMGNPTLRAQEHADYKADAFASGASGV